MRLIDGEELLTKEHQYYNYLADEWFVPVRDIENAPTIEERKKGQWRYYDGMCSCSVCQSHMDDISPFCPMCGADMRG